MRKLDQKQYAASAADAKAPSEGNQINANEAINVIHVSYESTPVKVAYEFLAMNAPYKEMERRAFPAYIQKIADLLTYDEKQNLSYGVLVRRFPTQEGIVVYRNRTNHLVKRKMQDVSKLGLIFGKEHLPCRFILPASPKRGRPRRDDRER